MDDKLLSATALAVPDRASSRPLVVPPGLGEVAFTELEASVGLALETYANVHRGTGYNSMASTLLYGQARDAILNVLGLEKSRYAVVFCTPARAASLEAASRRGRPVVLSSRDLGLPLGLRAVIIRSDALTKGAPSQTGGGTVRMVSRRSVVWEGAPDRFEAGTPAVINALAFARALQLARRFGSQAFKPCANGIASPLEILHVDDLLGFSGRELLTRLRLTTIGRGRPVPTEEGPSPYVHLDNAASTPTFKPVWRAVRLAWRLPEDRRTELVAAVRSLCAGFFGAPAENYDVIFTSNTTEAVNLAAHALVPKPPRGTVPECETVVLNTDAEHNSNELPWRFAQGATLVRTPVDDEGFPDLGEMERLLREYNVDRAHGRKRIRIVAVSGASNVLGACPDLAEVARIAHRHQALVFVDAAQLAAHRAIRMDADGLDGLAFSGHKMYAPFGAGGLILRKGLWPAGDEAFESARMSGDENVAGIAALGKAIDLLERVGMDVVGEEEMKLTRTALRELAGVPGIRVYGIADPDSPRISRRLGVISFELANIPHNLAAAQLAESAGVGVRTGCHCAHILVKRLLRMHPAREAVSNLGMRFAPRITRSVLPGLVRASLGLENDEDDVRRLAFALVKIGGRRRNFVTRLLAKTHNAVPALPVTKTRKLMRAVIVREASSVYGVPLAESKEDRPKSKAPSDRIPSRSLTFLGRPCCRKL